MVCMNEQIKKLADQAGYKPLPGFDFANSLEEAFIKKFAELIVEQCFRLALVEGKGYLDPVKLRNAMKQHFGVE